MSTKLSPDQLEQVRRWAAQGTDLNGIQKKLVAECGVHMTYMDVRFLLLDHGIEIASVAAPAPAEKPAPSAPEAAAAPQVPSASAEPAPATGAQVQVSLDDLQIPGTLLSGKAEFPGGTRGSWQIDQMGRFGWSELSGTPSPEDMRAFESELRRLLSRM